MADVLHPSQAQLDRIEHKLDKLLTGASKEMSGLDTLAANVKRNTDVIASAKQVLAGLAQQIRDAGTNEAKLTALAATLDTDDAGLAAAIAAGTPAAAV